jgi:hypothetical protein
MSAIFSIGDISPESEIKNSKEKKSNFRAFQSPEVRGKKKKKNRQIGISCFHCVAKT